MIHSFLVWATPTALCAPLTMAHRPTLQRSSRDVSLSNPFAFIHFRTLLPNGAFSTPLPSIACALFPMQWGVGLDLILSQAPVTNHQSLRCKFALLFSTTSTMLLPQPISFQAFALLPGGGYAPYPRNPQQSAATKHNFQQLAHCSHFSPPLRLLCFHALTHCPICNPFVLNAIQQCRGGGPGTGEEK